MSGVLCDCKLNYISTSIAVIYILLPNAPKGEKFEDTKRVIKSRKSKDRQYNGQNKNIKMTNNDLQNTTEKTKD
jgi:hypothetical protein